MQLKSGTSFFPSLTFNLSPLKKPSPIFPAEINTSQNEKSCKNKNKKKKKNSHDHSYVVANMRADTGLESPAAVQSDGVGVCQDDQHPLWAAEWYHELPRQQPATESLEKMHDRKKLGPAA